MANKTSLFIYLFIYLFYFLATEQYFAVVFICKGGRNVCIWGSNHSVTIQMKATEQYFPMVLFITLYNVVLTFLSL